MDRKNLTREEESDSVTDNLDVIGSGNAALMGM